MHLLQPLDSIPFQQLKKNHAAAVNRLLYKSSQNYDKVHFLSDIAFIRDSTFTIAVIQAGWRETGLFLLNQDLVLNRIGALEALDCIEPTVMLDRDQVINDTANVPDYVADSMENRTPAHASDPPLSTPRTVQSTR
ncbi:hypothetical protein BDW59DRAFT_136655 [Aspergillus cavernicola]|uniref:Uncharacterized protein n=1 Tax=Aspergillus cavernicola TaxID=176166 RepID=A0ABR4HMC7_9EURO